MDMVGFVDRTRDRARAEIEAVNASPTSRVEETAQRAQCLGCDRAGDGMGQRRIEQLPFPIALRGDRAFLFYATEIGARPPPSAIGAERPAEAQHAVRRDLAKSGDQRLIAGRQEGWVIE